MAVETTSQKTQPAQPATSPPRTTPENGHGPDGHQPPTHAPQEDEIGRPPPPPRPNFIWLLLALLLVAGIFAGLFLAGWLPMLSREKGLTTASEKIKNSLPRVNAVHPRQSPAITVAILPGDVQALEEITIYARTSGYLKRWLVDIGDEVRAGQLLAEIEIPEIDDELRQANATLGQLAAKQATAEANNQLAQTTLRRYEALAMSKSISQQELDERRATADTAASAVTAAKADVIGGQASVQRLTTLVSFSHVFAPFAGTITARNIDVGQLVTAGNGLGQALFHLSKTDPARVFVNVPQTYSGGVRAGLKAEVTVREIANRNFVGKVTRSARAIDPQTRTMLTEIQVPNPDHALLPGSYVRVRMDVSREHPPLLIPASALIFNADGTTVALLKENRRVHFQKVEVEGDFGADVGISAGLTTAGLVISNPGQRLTEGGPVAADEPATERIEDATKAEK